MLKKLSDKGLGTAKAYVSLKAKSLQDDALTSQDLRADFPSQGASLLEIQRDRIALQGRNDQLQRSKLFA